MSKKLDELNEFNKRCKEKYIEKEEKHENIKKQYISKQKIESRLKKLKDDLKFIACNEDCRKCFDKEGKVLYRGGDFIFCYAYYQIKVLQELLQESEEK